MAVFESEALYALQNSLSSAQSDILSSLANVSQCLSEILEKMHRQLEVLEQRKKQMKELYDNANSQYSTCLQSQTYDKESGEYTPSCSYERRSMEAAKGAYDQVCRLYEEGKRIVYDVELEAGYYEGNQGAREYLQYTAEEQISKAKNKLAEVIAKVVEYNDVPIPSSEGANVIMNTHAQNPNYKKVRFEAAKNFIEIKSERKKYVPLEICKCCGRPRPLCTCGRGARERER